MKTFATMLQSALTQHMMSPVLRLVNELVAVDPIENKQFGTCVRV